MPPSAPRPPAVPPGPDAAAGAPRRAERDRLIADHIDVAHRIAQRMARRCPPWIASEDLVAAGLVGLAEAAERYDQRRPEPFLVFAEKRIRGAVLDELRRGDIMPRRIRQRARRVGAAIAALERQVGGTPDDASVATALGVTVETYREELEHLVHVTVGALDDVDGSMVFASREPSPAAHAERRQTLGRIRAALGALDRRDVLVLSLYYNEELTYVEIADVLGVTTSRVCQLHGRAIARLRAELEPAARASAPRHPARRRTRTSAELLSAAALAAYPSTDP